MVVEVNGGDEGCGEAERCRDVYNLERASRSWHRANLSDCRLNPKSISNEFNPDMHLKQLAILLKYMSFKNIGLFNRIPDLCF
jgi:hypothetical protein